MTIRKRYDEAQVLLRAGMNEPSLILLLVAIAAAAERRRRAETNGARKARGDDRKYFSSYVAPVVSINVRGRHAADILYGELRCTAIHEGRVEGVRFQPDNVTVYFEENGIVFGSGLLRGLSELLRTDSLGRDEFRDLLNEFENIVQFSGDDLNAYRARFAEERGLSLGRVSILEQIIAGLLPERLAAMTFEEMSATLRHKMLPNLHLFGLNEGALTGLRGRFNPDDIRVLDDRNRLTEDGFAAIRDLSAGFRTIDAAPQAP